YDTEGNRLDNLDIGIQPTACTVSAENGWLFAMNAAGNRDIHVFDINNDFQQIGIIDNYRGMINNYWSRSLLWVDQHPGGQLWLNTQRGAQNNNGNTAWQISVDTGDWSAVEQVQSIDTWTEGSGYEWDGLGHDGHNLWSTQYGSADTRVIDDGVAEYYWLILWEGDIGEQNPEDWVMVRGQYEIEPDDQMLMTARLDASTIERGDYQAIIHYLSNDPDEGEDDLELPVLLHVTDAQDIEVAWEAEYGYPDLLDWNLAYDNVLVAQPYEMTITVENASMDVSDLVVSDIVSDDEDFSVDPTEFTLEPGASQEVIITFEADADAAGEYDALLTIYSDDPDEDEWPIPLHAAAVYDLQIAPAPESIASELMTGETDEITLNLSNESGDLRRFRIDREILSEPERDDQQRALRRIDRSRGPGRDAAGDLVDAFDEPVGGINRYKGLIWDADNEWMWISHYSSPYQCWPVDPDNDYQRVDGQGWNGFAGQMSGVMADNELYIVTFSGGWYVYRYSRQGQ
ncbi:MAG TPA: hypothetical protein ENL08_02145, partial [Bacteroidetes bacterium]|nr:hypothetical protein [Bacteroidota bacterium]